MSISSALDRDLANVRPLREQRQATRVAFCVPHPGDTVRSLPQQATLKATALGLFEEIDYAWFAVGRRLYLWHWNERDSEQSSHVLDLIEHAAGDIIGAYVVPAARSSGSLFEGMNDIVNAGFNFVSHVLVVVTASHVALLAIEMGDPTRDSNAAAYMERPFRITAVRQHTQQRVDLPVLSTEGVRMNRVATSAHGRLLLAGDDGNIYEIASEPHDPRVFAIKSWFPGWYRPTRPMLRWASGERWTSSAWLRKESVNDAGDRVALIDIAFDDARKLLHTLSVATSHHDRSQRATACTVLTYRCDGATRGSSLTLVCEVALPLDPPLARAGSGSRIFAVPRCDSSAVCAVAVLANGASHFVEEPERAGGGRSVRRGCAPLALCAAEAGPRKSAPQPYRAGNEYESARGRTVLSSLYAVGGVFMTALSCDTELMEWLQTDVGKKWPAIEEKLRPQIEGLRDIKQHSVAVGKDGALYLALGIDAESPLENQGERVMGARRSTRRSARRGVGYSLSRASRARADVDPYAHVKSVLCDVFSEVLEARQRGMVIAVTSVVAREQQQSEWAVAVTATIEIRSINAARGVIDPSAKVVTLKPAFMGRDEAMGGMGGASEAALCAVQELRIEAGVIVIGDKVKAKWHRGSGEYKDATVTSVNINGTFDLDFRTSAAEALEEDFKKYDADHSGSIDREELAQLLKERRPLPRIDGKEITVEWVMETYDDDHSNELEKEEFDKMLIDIGDPVKNVSRKHIKKKGADPWSGPSSRGLGGHDVATRRKHSRADEPTVALVHALNEPNIQGSCLCAIAERPSPRVESSSLLSQRGSDAGLGVYSTQLTSQPREFICLTSRTLRRWVIQRPIDEIRAYMMEPALSKRQPLDRFEFWKHIFAMHGVCESFAMLLALNCKEREGEGRRKAPYDFTTEVDAIEGAIEEAAAEGDDISAKWVDAVYAYIARVLRPVWLQSGATSTGAAARWKLAGNECFPDEPVMGASFYAGKGNGNLPLRIHSVQDAEKLRVPLAQLLQLLDDGGSEAGGAAGAEGAAGAVGLCELIRIDDSSKLDEIKQLLQRSLLGIELLRQAERLASIGGGATAMARPQVEEVLRRINHATRFMQHSAELRMRCDLRSRAHADGSLVPREQLLLCEAERVMQLLVGEDDIIVGDALGELEHLASLTFSDIVCREEDGAAADWAARMIPAMVTTLMFESATESATSSDGDDDDVDVMRPLTLVDLVRDAGAEWKEASTEFHTRCKTSQRLKAMGSFVDLACDHANEHSAVAIEITRLGGDGRELAIALAQTGATIAAQDSSDSCGLRDSAIRLAILAMTWLRKQLDSSTSMRDLIDSGALKPTLSLGSTLDEIVELARRVGKVKWDTAAGVGLDDYLTVLTGQGGSLSRDDWALDRMCSTRVYAAVYRSCIDEAFVDQVRSRAVGGVANSKRQRKERGSGGDEFVKQLSLEAHLLHPFLLRWTLQMYQRDVEPEIDAPPPLIASWLYLQGHHAAAVHVLLGMARTNAPTWLVHVIRRQQWLLQVLEWLEAEVHSPGISDLTFLVQQLLATAGTQVDLYNAAKDPLAHCRQEKWTQIKFELCNGVEMLRKFALPFMAGTFGQGPSVVSLSPHRRDAHVACLRFLSKSRLSQPGSEVERKMVYDLWQIALSKMVSTPSIGAGLGELKELLDALHPELAREAISRKSLLLPPLSDAGMADPRSPELAGVVPMWQICGEWSSVVTGDADAVVAVNAFLAAIKAKLEYARDVAEEKPTVVGDAFSRHERASLCSMLRGHPSEDEGAAATATLQRRHELIEEFRKRDLPVLIRQIDQFRMDALAREDTSHTASHAAATTASEKWEGTLRCLCVVLDRFETLAGKLLTRSFSAAVDDLWLDLQSVRTLYRCFYHLWLELISGDVAEDTEEMMWDVDSIVCDAPAAPAGGARGADEEGVVSQLELRRAALKGHIDQWTT